MAQRPKPFGGLLITAWVIVGGGVLAGLGTLLGGYVGAAAGAVVGIAVPLVIAWLEARRRRYRQIRSEFDQMSHDKPSGAWTEDHGYAALLRPDLGVVPFTGRDLDLRRLVAWAGDPHGGSVLLLTGGAGVGKTRLALEVADRLEKAGWLTASVRQDFESIAVERTVAMLDSHHRRRRSTRDCALLILDYAETRPNLERLLDQIGPDAGRIRILLLARDAGEWWRQLSAAPKTRAVFAANLPMTLGKQVIADQNDNLIVENAIPRFADALGYSIPPNVGVGPLLDELPSILSLHSAALVAVLTSRESLGRAADDVFGAVLDHEERYWQRSAGTAGLVQMEVPILRRAVALACLLPVPNDASGTEDDVSEILKRVPDLSDSPTQLRYTVARWLAGLYPASSKSGIGSLQPDLFAERHVCTELNGSAAFSRNALSNLSPDETMHVLTVLTRASRHDPAASQLMRVALSADLTQVAPLAIAVAKQTDGELAAVLADVIEKADTDRETLEGILHLIPDRTVALARTAAVVAQRVADLSANSTEYDRAFAEGEAGARWLDVDRTVAQKTLQTAANRCERLPATDQKGTASLYGWVLGNLGLAWSRDDRQRAVGFLRRSVELLTSTPTSGEDPGVLASGLRQLGALMEKEDVDSARAYTDRALSIYRGLAATSTDGSESPYHADIALCLDTLGVLWRDSDPRLARQMNEQSVDLFRELARIDPDFHRPSFAQSLVDLGELLVSSDARSAIGYLGEAVAVYSTLVGRDPDKFEPDLARALLLLAQAEAAAGEAANAISHGEQAVNRLERLAVADVAQFGPDFGQGLRALRDYYWSADREPERAFGPAQRAVDMYTTLCDVSESFRVELAGALDRLGTMYAATDSRRALELTTRAVAAYRLAISGADNDHTADLARALISLGALHAAAAKMDKAVVAVVEAVELVGALAPDAVESLRRRVRRVRRADPFSFDAHWKKISGTDPPPWLATP
jgi:tetratricopeptide (TPR) repeat protein